MIVIWRRGGRATWQTKATGDVVVVVWTAYNLEVNCRPTKRGEAKIPVMADGVS